MQWPFNSSSSGKAPAPSKPEEDGKDSKRNKPTTWNDLLPQPDPPLQAAKEWAPVFLTTVVSLGAFIFYQSRLRRFPSAGHIQPDLFRKRTLFGRVTSVGDGDNFHMFHTPGGRLAGWDWLRKVPSTRAALKGKTIPVRLAGIDAPEGAHFGRPGQPGAKEALKWLTDYILNRRIWARIHKRDQYDRVVATVYVRRFLLKKDVGLEMLKRGLATTYEAKSGVEWGGFEEVYKVAEAKAKAKKLGIWSGKASDFESPRAYKTRVNEAEQKKTGWFF
ncbi:nuclease domain containing protein [Colletotrichum truncatum]|uniref:Nuclease domain containing protein n=1 Tax=Colletotrichum truncatum TaxID=5467 RepID=A0ACC3Z3P1_COLTU|nr:nuclease domain containing protein [Colletotrichum truncatum]KAF6795565.1 nuclease domain containing protein [Colletotrichum truncatum]